MARNEINFAGKFKIGDHVRAYEFEPCRGRGDCYHEGEIIDASNTEMGYGAYVLRVTRHVFGGESVSFPKELSVYVPFAVYFRDYAHRIIPV